jgi:hypothetical protein
MLLENAPIQSIAKARSSRAVIGLVLALAGVLAACGDRRGATAQRPTGSPAEGEAAYRPPPVANFSQRLAGGMILVGGSADPGTHVRLSSPDGMITPASESGPGAWRARLPPSQTVRLFGLAAVDHGRTVQSEGYLAVTPGGSSAQLRAGAGARVIAPRGVLRILAIDFDRKGGVVMSGAGSPGETVSIVADAVPRGRVQVDADGRFTFPFDEPLSLASHSFEAQDRQTRSQASVTLAPPAPITVGPYRAVRESGGWRIDWLTPGGGAQATLLLAPEEPGA